ncbi:MAG TPA: FG-GAP-like repeat-containing protein, partial [Vicinamibacterales bacterium]|nr:FG-GAP-like repeat-containing protein [Vicinamibacterales bacterium]
WDGESTNDQFGWIARNIGDVDGDGVPDVVTSAPTSNAGGQAAGRIYVYSTKTGRLLWRADGEAKAQLGTGVEGAGDTNNDGISDVVASAPGIGAAYVYSGRDGRVLLTFHAEDANDLFGRHASGAGDVDGDGYADVIVGAPQNQANGPAAGRAYVYSGKDGHVLLTLTGAHAGDHFGSSVAGYSDGKHHLLVVGAPGAGPDRHGRTFVYTSLSATPAFAIDADSTGSALGAMFVSIPGDVDGDGVPDVYVSDWSNSAKGQSTGRVYVHSGKDGHRLFTFTGETAGEGFGTSPSVAGDVDHDGHADLIVGAWQYSGAALSGGRAYLYSGKDGRLVKTFTCRTPGDTFGFDAVNLGDVDGDGTIDFLITSGWSGVHGYHSGRVFIVSSGVGPTS